MAHKHGSAYPTPQAKKELIYHLEHSHADKVKVTLDAHRWTRVELVETHRIIHIGEVNLPALDGEPFEWDCDCIPGVPHTQGCSA